MSVTIVCQLEIQSNASCGCIVVGHSDINTPWDVQQQNTLVFRDCSNHFPDSDCCSRKDY